MDLQDRIEELEWVLKEVNKHLDSAIEREDGKDIWSIGPAAVQLQITINSMKESVG